MGTVLLFQTHEVTKGQSFHIISGEQTKDSGGMVVNYEQNGWN